MSISSFKYYFYRSSEFDRDIDISIQFLNPSIRFKMHEIQEWFIWQTSFLKLIYRYNQNIEAK